jgi:hypothetical protein
MEDEVVTRKQFIVSVLSITALLIANKVVNKVTNKVPTLAKDFTLKKGNSTYGNKGNNTYGNYVYGGDKKNA